MPDLDLRAARLRAEREVIQAALARSNNTLSVAARLLGISRPTLYSLMQAHAIEVDLGQGRRRRRGNRRRAGPGPDPPASGSRRHSGQRLRLKVMRYRSCGWFLLGAWIGDLAAGCPCRTISLMRATR